MLLDPTPKTPKGPGARSKGSQRLTAVIRDRPNLGSRGSIGLAIRGQAGARSARTPQALLCRFVAEIQLRKRYAMLSAYG